MGFMDLNHKKHAGIQQLIVLKHDGNFLRDKYDTVEPRCRNGNLAWTHQKKTQETLCFNWDATKFVALFTLQLNGNFRILKWRYCTI